jgi:hypothetical protein
MSLFTKIIPVSVTISDNCLNYELGQDMEIKGRQYERGHIINGWDFYSLHIKPLIMPADEETILTNLESIRFEETPNAFLQRGFVDDFIPSQRKPRPIYFLRLKKLDGDIGLRRFHQCDVPLEDFNNLFI